MTSHVSIEDRDGIRWLRINRPERMNALSLAMYEALTAALAGADADPHLRAVVLSGVDGVFTSGNDLKDFMSNPPVPGQPHPVMGFLEALANFDKPLVVGVDGPAIGIGTTLLLLSDFVVVTERARLRLPFVNLALVPEAGSSMLLALACGHRKAAELLMLGDFFNAEEAVACGIANRKVAHWALPATLDALAHRLAAQPIGSLIATKRLMRAPYREELLATMRREGDEFMRRLQSPEAMEAMTAFFEKRTPDFRQFTS